MEIDTDLPLSEEPATDICSNPSMSVLSPNAEACYEEEEKVEEVPVKTEEEVVDEIQGMIGGLLQAQAKMV